MANALYDKGREAFLDGLIAWSSHNIKCVLVDTGAYTANLATDTFLSDVPALARIATSGNLASKTVTAGVADAANVTFTAVTGVSCEALVIYRDTGVVGTSRLIARIDTATGLPATPDGSDIAVAWDDGANRIFKL